MYLDYFGLRTKPFELVPDPAFLFLGKSHRLALSHLEYGLKEKAGFILLTGEVGSGKTTLIRDIVRRIGNQAAPAIIVNTQVDPDQLLALINEDFGLQVAGKNKVQLIRDLNDFLIQENGIGRTPILIIDEAQNLPVEVLEEVRLLSNVEADSFKLLQIVLVGQPELKTRISLPQLRQLNQRIGIRCHLLPLDTDEIREYILYRLERAGNRDAVIFHDASFTIIERYSQGVPRLINIFCDFLLLAAFVEKTRELSPQLVEEVVGEASGGPYAGDVPESAPPDVGEEREGSVQESLLRIIDLLESLPARIRTALLRDEAASDARQRGPSSAFDVRQFHWGE